VFGSPLGFLLLIVRLLEQGWLIITGRAHGFDLADEAAEMLAARGGDDVHRDPLHSPTR